MIMYRLYLEIVTTIKEELKQRVMGHQVFRTEFLAPLRSEAKFSLTSIGSGFYPILMKETQQLPFMKTSNLLPLLPSVTPLLCLKFR